MNLRENGRNFWHGVGLVIILASVYWVVQKAIAGGLDFRTLIETADLFRIIAGSAMLALSVFLAGIPFIAIARFFSKHETPLDHLLFLQFCGQLARHLPGRVWGLAFQLSNVRDSALASVVLRSHLDSALLGLGWSVLFPISLYAVNRYPWTLAYFVALLLVASAIFLSYGTFRLLPKRLCNWISGKSAGVSGAELLSAPTFFSRTNAIVIGALLCSWVVFTSGMCVLIQGIFDLDLAVCLDIVVVYGISWLAGYMSFLTPGGIGVREATFVLLVPAISKGDAALMAVYFRLIFLATEFLLAGIAFIIYFLRNFREK